MASSAARSSERRVRPDHDRAARQALAHVVVGLADQLQRHVLVGERAEALAGRAGEPPADGSTDACPLDETRGVGAERALRGGDGRRDAQRVADRRAPTGCSSGGTVGRVRPPAGAMYDRRRSRASAGEAGSRSHLEARAARDRRAGRALGVHAGAPSSRSRSKVRSRSVAGRSRLASPTTSASAAAAQPRQLRADILRDGA